MPQRDNTAGVRDALAKRNSNAEAAPTGTSLHGWLKGMEGELARALPSGGLTANRLARIVLTEVRRIPRLGECTRESFAGALMTCAQLGLEPGSATGEAWLLPFRNGKTGKYEVTLVVGYQGMAKLYWQSPLAKSLDAQVVYEHDDFDYAYGLSPDLTHKPSLGNRGKAIAYYAVATMTSGGSAFVVLSPDDVERIRARSKAKDDGPWKTDYDAMAKKTCVRQLFKLIPKSPQLTAAIVQDESVRTDRALGGIDFTGDVIDAEPTDDALTQFAVEDGQRIDTATGEVLDAEPEIAAEIVEEPEPGPDVAPVSKSQVTRIQATFGQLGYTARADRLAFCVQTIDRSVQSVNDLTRDEASRVIDALETEAAAADENPPEDPGSTP